jgi:hypothetical protein
MTLSYSRRPPSCPRAYATGFRWISTFEVERTLQLTELTNNTLSNADIDGTMVDVMGESPGCLDSFPGPDQASDKSG